MSLVLFGSTQSVSIECQYATPVSWGSLGKRYVCYVTNNVSITSLEAAQVDSITGTHQDGYNNDNVDAISITQKQIHYFPRGLNNFFKNLRGIEIHDTGLKEIHQSDLKDYPKLMNLYLYFNNLEIIEENLFEFNPNLEAISFWSNKISHVDPNVFDILTKLKSLSIGSETCIKMGVDNNPAGVQNLIATARAQCTNLDYSSLEQKVKYLEFESRILDSETLNEKLESLENEIKNSKFANFFHEKLACLYAVVIQKEREDVFDSKLTNIEEMVANITPGNGMGNKNNIVLNIS